MREIALILLFLLVLTNGFGLYDLIETEIRELIGLIGASLIILHIIGSFLLRQHIPESTGIVRLLFGGEKSLFEKGSIRCAAAGTIIVYAILLFGSIAYLVWYIAFRI